MTLLLRAVWPLSVALAGLWALRLWRTGLHRRYRWLFAYLSVEFIFGSLGLFLYYSALQVGGRLAYGVWWPIVQPIQWLLSFGVVFEIFDRLLQGYRGLQRLGRLVVYGALGLIGGIVIVSLVFNAFTFADFDRWKIFWLKQDQSITLILAGSLFLLFVFQKAFPSVANPNVRLLFVVFGLSASVEAMLVVIRNYLGPEFRGVRDLLASGAYAACLLLGWLRFSTAGEISPLDAAPAERRGELAGAAGAAARQMKSFNDRLETILRT
jgi:hypothetical protein